MNLGRWDSAIFKSVFLPAFILLLYALYEMGFPNDFDSLAGLGMFAALFIGVYLLFSLGGWLLIGFPSHWLICKYGNGSYFWYIATAILFAGLLYFFTDVAEVAAIYGFFALIQAVLFKYYAYKQTKT